MSSTLGRDSSRVTVFFQRRSKKTSILFMGQCTSNKAKGNLSVKKILSNKKPKKMDKHKQSREPKDEDNKSRPMAGGKEVKHLDLNKKPNEKYSKGVAMSFGFKRRPTPMTSNNCSVAWDSEATRPDPNGNKDETLNVLARNNALKDKTTHKPLPSSQKHTISITPRTSRFSLPSTTTERTNKVADIKSSPLQFGSTNQSRPGSRRTSPSTETEHMLNRTFARNLTIVTKTEVIEKAEIVKDSNENTTPSLKDRLGGIQTGKFTFQTTRLPYPEPIRVIETKTAKTIANNNKRSARIWRQYEEASLKMEAPNNDDSGFGSNVSGGIGEVANVVSNLSCIARRSDPMQERLQRSNRFSLLEKSDSYSDACTPPPLPQLPSEFNFGKETDTNREKESKNLTDKYNCRKIFVKTTTPTTALLKTREMHFLDRDSPPSSSDQEWLNGGEAMADDISLTLSPKRIYPGNKQQVVPNKSTRPKSKVVAEAVLQSLLEPSVSLEMIDSLKDSMNLSLSDEDPHFTAVATNNNTGALLDDEILSPVESLLSCSETEELLNKKMADPSSNSKDVNEKLTLSSPGSPSHATLSLSLSDDKEDFLIDDEIADQPALVFEEGNTVEHGSVHRYSQDTMEKDSISFNPRGTSYNSDFSPLPLRKRRDILPSNNQGSFDSLSPCDSMCSEDLMMDFDVSQTNEPEIWERRSGSFTSAEGTPKFKFKTDDTNFNNKNFFKGLAPKNVLTNGTPTQITHSPTSLKSRVSHKSTSESRSPKTSNFTAFGFQSMTYDPTSESLTLTRANHSAVQQDIIGIKTMLLTLKRVLNESEIHHPLKNCTEESYNNCQNSNNNSEFRHELADLRRQVLFLQGQLEDKEKTVSDLQKQIDELPIYNNTQYSLDNDSHLPVDIQNKCNAATQTERARPLSTGVFSLTSSPIEDNNPILRFMVK